MSDDMNDVMIDEIRQRRIMDYQDMKAEMADKEMDDKEALYIVLRSAEYGCAQKYIKHVAGMCGYSWPAPEGDLTRW